MFKDIVYFLFKGILWLRWIRLGRGKRIYDLNKVFIYKFGIVLIFNLEFKFKVILYFGIFGMVNVLNLDKGRENINKLKLSDVLLRMDRLINMESLYRIFYIIKFIIFILKWEKLFGIYINNLFFDNFFLIWYYYLIFCIKRNV